MPFGDGTGPMGFGPMTGRAAGYCAGYGVPGYMNPIAGRGFGGGGRGFGRGYGRGGRGRGWRHWYYATGLPGWSRANWGWPQWGAAPMVPYGVPHAVGGAVPFGAPFAPQMDREQEIEALKAQAQSFEETLEGIRNRISELETEASEK